MKYLATLLLFLFAAGLNAQADEPYAPYRPGTYYRYENTMPIPDWGDETPVTSPVVEMIWPRDVSNIIDDFTGYQNLVPQSQPGTYEFSYHFAGELYQGQATGLLEVYSSSSRFTLDYAASVGVTYMATRELRASVDSIVQEEFLGLTDSVKYISISDTNNILPVRSLKISKKYGMIQGIHFAEPIRLTNTYPLVSINSHSVNVGEILTPRMIGTARDRDEYFVQKERITNRNGQAGKQISRIRYRLNSHECDLFFNESVAAFTVKELTFFLPDNGDPPTDTIALPTNFATIRIGFVPTKSNWQALPIGHAIGINDDEYYAMILPATDDCLGIGKRLSRPFKYDEVGHLVVDEEANPGPAQYPSVFLQSGEDLETEGVTSRIIGLQTFETTCGEIIDFSRFYSSLQDFPNDPRINLFPNPASSMVRIEIPQDLGPTALSIYDVAGKQVGRTSFQTGDHLLSVGNWSGGNYTVVITGENGAVGRRQFVVR